jgi:hypothetical protein
MEIVDHMGQRLSVQAIADQDAVVVDPITGTNANVFAGQPIPFGLENAYEEATAAKKSRKKSS